MDNLIAAKETVAENHRMLERAKAEVAELLASDEDVDAEVERLIPAEGRLRVLELRSKSKDGSVGDAIKALADGVVAAQSYFGRLASELYMSRLKTAREAPAKVLFKSVNRLSPSEERSPRQTPAVREADVLT